MRYMMLIYHDENNPAVLPAGQLEQAFRDFTDEVQKAGVMKGGDPIQPSALAKTVRVRNGQTMTTDGPFAETKEQIGGFYVFECKSEAEALAYAAKIPGAAYGSIEVRQIVEM